MGDHSGSRGDRHPGDMDQEGHSDWTRTTDRYRSNSQMVRDWVLGSLPQVPASAGRQKEFFL